MILTKQAKSRTRSTIDLTNKSHNDFDTNIANEHSNSSIMFKNKMHQKIKNLEDVYVDKDQSTQYKNDEFNWVHYILINPDLFYSNVITRESALTHYINHGKTENRKTILDINEYDDYLHIYMNYKNEIKNLFFDPIMEKKFKNNYTSEEWEKFNKYPSLFHKYLLFIRNPNTPIQYKIAKQVAIFKKNICAIHCYDLNYFDEYFYPYLTIISNYFDIIVTYCLDNYDVLNKYNFTFIISQNVGMDIGGKFVATRYLENFKVNYDYIFFIHSKSDPVKRKHYIGNFTQNIKTIMKFINNNEIGGYFSNMFYLGDIKMNCIKYDPITLNSVHDVRWTGNEKYYREIKNYLNFHNDNYFFAEGNVYILHKKIVREIFSDVHLFNTLNTTNSFDYNWFATFYRENDNIFNINNETENRHILYSYKMFKNEKLFGNNLSTGLGHAGLPDCMIEHVFERLIINCIINKNMSIKITNNYDNNGINFKILENYLNDARIEKNKQTNLEIFNKISMDCYYNDLNFCLFTYLYLNQDLKVLSLEDLKSHWKKYGFNEKRKCLIKKFNYEVYVNFYSDFRKCGIDTFSKAIEHWNEYGINQGRIASISFLKRMYDEYLQTNFKKPRTFLEKCNIIEKHCNFNDNYSLNTTSMSDKFNAPFFKNFQFINTLDVFDNLLLVLDFPYWGGGCSMFLQNIIDMYGKTTNLLIARNFNGIIYFYVNDIFIIKVGFNEEEAVNYINSLSFKISKVFINSIIHHSFNFLEAVLNMNKRVTCITHDYSLLFNDSTGCYNELTIKQKNSLLNLTKVHHFITQNENNLDIYSKFLPDGKPITITGLPDFKNKLSQILTINTKTVIGFIGNISEIKGFYMVSRLIELSKIDNTFEVIIFGRINMNYDKQYSYANIDELNILLEKYKPNVWIDGSIVPETYSFTLTLMMITGLPIFYQAKTFNSVMENRLESYNNKYEFDNIYDLLDDITILTAKRQDYFYTIDNKIYFNDFWDSYFGKTDIRNKHDISAYCVYFPQFHVIPENNLNFYENFTDCVNLNYVNANLPEITIETPNKTIFDNIAPWEYNLEKRPEFMQKQIDILENYGLNGFAIYYYWFSINTITGKNMIMETVINKFFDESLNMKGRKVFFIWANEDWTKNAAFGETTERIENLYDNDSIVQNIINLIPYFKNDNYLKIDNKPVFLIHHPWFIPSENIDNIFYLFDQICLQNGFSGIHFILNSMDNTYLGHKHYDFNFNYKNDKSGSVYVNEKGVTVLDYSHYTNWVSCDNNNIKTLVFDFDNRVRLAAPKNKINLATVCINNTGEQQLKFVKKIVDSYANSNAGVDKIMLINAWNEWGEKMIMEPSNEKGFYYLNMLNSLLKN